MILKITLLLVFAASDSVISGFGSGPGYFFSVSAALLLEGWTYRDRNVRPQGELPSPQPSAQVLAQVLVLVSVPVSTQVLAQLSVLVSVPVSAQALSQLLISPDKGHLLSQLPP